MNAICEVDYMQCNIDARGKAARMKLGIKLLFLAIIVGGLIALNIIESSIWWALLGIILFSSAFTIFEARAGWCIIRAMGFKTKI